MSSQGAQFDTDTRPMKLSSADKPMTAGETGLLDVECPWVIEFRIPGTISTLQVRIGDSMVVGRADSASGFVPDVDLSSLNAFVNGVSRQHALITIQDQRMMITDLYSTNGTRINNNECNPGEAYRLRHGSELTVGKLCFQVSFAVVPMLTDTQRTSPLKKKTALPILIGDRKQVLVVEDDDAVGNVYRIALEFAGYTVTVVSEAAKALAAFSQRMPDVIILDLMLPDTNGLDLARYLRKQKAARHIPVLVVSGAMGGFQMNQALEAGANAFMGKPVAVEELLKAVENIIKVSASGFGLGAPSGESSSS
jgi:CheY-like chemotaxis protein